MLDKIKNIFSKEVDQDKDVTEVQTKQKNQLPTYFVGGFFICLIIALVGSVFVLLSPIIALTLIIHMALNNGRLPNVKAPRLPLSQQKYPTFKKLDLTNI